LNKLLNKNIKYKKGVIMQRNYLTFIWFLSGAWEPDKFITD